MKRTLKYFFKREAYNQTKKAFRELEKAGENQQENRREKREPRAHAERRGSSSENGQADASSDLKGVLQTMDDYEFEHFIGDVWERMGWSTEVSTQSADKGIDVVATRRSPYEEKALIQAKRYGPNTTVGSPDIQQYASLKHQRHGVDKVLVVTTNRFSRQAEEIGRKLNVKLVDGDDLVALVSELDAMDLVEKYVPAVAEPEPEPELEPASDSQREPNPAPVETANLGVSNSGSTGGVRRADSFDEELIRRKASEGLLASRLPAERWKWVAGTTALWALGVALAGADGGVSMLVAWAGLPYAVLKDGHWTRWRRWYAAAALMPVFAMFVGGWYLLMRWRAVGFESAADSGERNGTAAEKQQGQHTARSKTVSADYSYDHYTEAVEDVKQLKREQRHDEAESLLWWCIESAEKQAIERGYNTVPPWYYKHLAIVYRKEGQHTDEVAVLQRYIEKGGRKDELIDRLETARKLAS